MMDGEGDYDDVAPASPMSASAAGEDDRSRTTGSTGSSNESDFSELETGDMSLSFDDGVAPSSFDKDDEENDRNRLRDIRMRGIGSADLTAAGDAARPVSAAWV